MTSYKKEDPQTIQAMFGSIASNYDKTNAILSFQLHKLWNSKLVHYVTDKHDATSLVDLCCGTGDIAFDLLKKRDSHCHAYLIDFCPEMLECARQKSHHLPHNKTHQISYIEADVQSIPLPDNRAACATMAYGIRNIKDPAKAIKEVFRVLQQDGRFGILELTQPQNRILASLHRCYLRFILPFLGKWLTNNGDAYHYLCNSIQTFVSPGAVETMLKQAGFENIRRHSLNGGIATIITGQKPKHHH